MRDRAAPSSAAAYSIGVAARLAGVPVETVRIWQRRYALPAPQRSPGGHRLYSNDDVALLQAAGALVSRGWRPADVFRLGVRGVLQAAAAAPAPPPPHDLARGIDAIVDAGLAYDDAAAAALLDEPLARHAVTDVAVGLWLPLLSRVGALWERGVVSIAVEHFLSQQVMHRVQAALRASASSSGPRALCACVPGERHEVGLLTAALLLQRAGFATVVLGGDVPATALAESARALPPALLLLSATAPLSAESTTTLPALLRQAPLSTVPLLLGGGSAAALGAALQRDHGVAAHVVAHVVDVVAAAEAAVA